jgi:hypothetical protein
MWAVSSNEKELNYRWAGTPRAGKERVDGTAALRAAATE